MAETGDAPLVAKGLSKGFAKRNADILDRMMAIDMQIAMQRTSRSNPPCFARAVSI